MNIVWFNGPSVRQFLQVPRQDLEIGCNFIERLRSVDHVCAYDRQVIDRLQVAPPTKYWTRPAIKNTGWETPDSKLRAFDSGTLGLVLAHALGLDHVYVLGCDWHTTNESVFDAVYDWRNYQPAKASLPKAKLIERINKHVAINIVTPRPWRIEANVISPDEFLSMFN